MPGYGNAAPGRGFGFGGGGWGGRGFDPGRSGGGRGWRNWFHATGLPRWARWGGHGWPTAQPDPASERRDLEQEAAALQAQLDAVRRRLAAVGAGVATEDV